MTHNQNIKQNKKILKAGRKKEQLSCKGRPIRVTPDASHWRLAERA